MSATEIRAAVEAARTHLPNLPSDYADQAVAAGKTVTAVKSELFVAMTSDPRARSKANMASLVAGMSGSAAEPATAGAATSRKSMLAEINRQHMEPAR